MVPELGRRRPRITRSNVGPWGLSRLTERRPIYLSPDLALPTSLSPAVAAALNGLSAKLTTDELSNLNIKVTVNHDDPSTVAQQWLQQKHLI